MVKFDCLSCGMEWRGAPTPPRQEGQPRVRPQCPKCKSYAVTEGMPPGELADLKGRL